MEIPAADGDMEDRAGVGGGVHGAVVFAALKSLGNPSSFCQLTTID
jgi:hypothetical protein